MDSTQLSYRRSCGGTGSRSGGLYGSRGACLRFSKGTLLVLFGYCHNHIRHGLCWPQNPALKLETKTKPRLGAGGYPCSSCHP